jgi:hypothetical protein
VGEYLLLLNILLLRDACERIRPTRAWGISGAATLIGFLELVNTTAGTAHFSPRRHGEETKPNTKSPRGLTLM